MRRHTYWTAWLASFATFTNHVLCAPDLAFPINAQLPPVAYASKLYSFTFADTTFQSDAQSLSYTLSSNPAWLSIDSASRTLRGTPSQSDVGAVTFSLTAVDASGSTATTVTLVVSSIQSIAAGEPILSSLQAFGQVQGPSTLFIKPLTSFSIPLSQQIFQGTSISTTYYAVSANNSPLPPWIQFDSQTFSVAGGTPPILSSSTQQQAYGVKIVATDVIGFSEASVTFTIAVANRLFYFQSATATANVTIGQTFRSPSYRDVLYLDGTPILESQLDSVQATLPSWLSLDPKTITLSGTPPDDFTGQIVTITARDQSSDIANITVVLTSAAATKGAALNISAQAGKYLTLTLSPSIAEVGDEIAVNFGSASDWLSFSDTNVSFYGQVPDDLKPTTLDLGLNVTKSGMTTSYPVLISIAAADILPTSSSSDAVTPTTDGVGLITATRAAEQNTGGRGNYVLAIVLTVVFVSLAVLAIILCCLWYRRKKDKKRQEKEAVDDEQGASHYSDAVSDMQDESVLEDMEDVPPPATAVSHKTQTSTREMLQTPSKVPQVELPWAPDSLKRTRSRLQKKRPAKAHDSIDSNWGGLVPTRSAPTASPTLSEVTEPGEIIHPGPPPPIPTYSPKRKQSLASSKVAKRTASKRSNDRRTSGALSNVTNRRSGLPNRLSNTGVGHGSGILAPSLRAGNPYRNSKPPPTRSSWATTLASMGGKENMRPSTATTNLEHFPLPPSTSNQENNSGHRTSGSLAGLTDTKPSLAGLASAPTKPSLRLVSASPSNSTSNFDHEEFLLRRKEFLKTRAKLEGDSTLFPSSGSRSRTPSISRFIPGTSAVRTASNTFPIAEEPSSESAGPVLNRNWSRLNANDRSPAPLAITPTMLNRGSRPTNSHILSPTPQRPPTRFGLKHNSNIPVTYGNNGVRASRPISVSSGQFSSALSSDEGSQWEDEILEMHSPYHGGASRAGGIRTVSAAESATDQLLYELSVGKARGRRVADQSANRKEWSTTETSKSSPLAGPADGNKNSSPRLPFDGGRPSGEAEEREVGLAIQKALKRASQLWSGENRGLRLVDKRKRVISVDGKDYEDAEPSGTAGRTSGSGAGVRRDHSGTSPGGGGTADSSTGSRYAWGGREKSQRGSLRFI